MKIETIEIAGLAGALTALRLPFGKEERSRIEHYCETYLDFTDMDVEQTEETYEVTMKGHPRFTSNTYIAIEPKDLTLMATLVKRGDEHAKVVIKFNHAPGVSRSVRGGVAESKGGTSNGYGTGLR